MNYLGARGLVSTAAFRRGRETIAESAGGKTGAEPETKLRCDKGGHCRISSAYYQDRVHCTWPGKIVVPPSWNPDDGGATGRDMAGVRGWDLGSSEEARLALEKGIKALHTGELRYKKWFHMIGPEFSSGLYGMLSVGMVNLAGILYARKWVLPLLPAHEG